jgi:hypothetical protein
MSGNGYRLKTNSEMSPYQKRIEAIDNAILCVAEAEKMVKEIGRSLFPGLEKKLILKPRKKISVFPWTGRNLRR